MDAGGNLTCAGACAEPGSTLEQCVLGCAQPSTLSFVDFIEPLILVCLSALASGLTLGLMSLDTTGLQIIVAGGEEPERSQAEKLLPLRKRGNQLLCTLLLTNTLVNSRLSIFLGSITSGIVGGLVATGLIVIFGEIIPQATCSRHALLVGATVVEPMRLVMALLSPITWPISKVLDRVLGDEITSGHTKREIEHLLRVQDVNDARDTPADARYADAHAHKRFITSTEKKLLGGVLALSEKTAQDVMTDFENIFMIEYSAKLDFRCLREIYRSGYTRVPVCDRSRTNLVGVLNTKDLVLVDADDELPVSEIMGACGRPIFTVSHNTPLDKMLNTFKMSRTHLALVQRLPEDAAALLPTPPPDALSDAVAAAVTLVSSSREPGATSASAQHQAHPLAPALAGVVGLDVTQASTSGSGLNMAEPIVLASSGNMTNIVGIVTLEDVLEELLQAEIVDENDCVEDNVTFKGVEGRQKELADRRFAFLDMLQHQPRSSMMATSLGPGFGSEIRMTHTELAAVCSFLSGNAAQFSEDVLSQEMLLTLIMQCRVCDVLPGTPAALICRRASPCKVAYLVLQGRVRVVAGAEGFKTEFGPWTLLAARSLEEEDYSPDFTATVVEHARLLLLSSNMYRQLAMAAKDINSASRMINIGRDDDDEERSGDNEEGEEGGGSGFEMMRISAARRKASASGRAGSSNSLLRSATRILSDDMSNAV